jgi:hypothetical protein
MKVFLDLVIWWIGFEYEFYFCGSFYNIGIFVVINGV